jgi:hypothetical protein
LAPLFPWWNQAELLVYLVEMDFCGEKIFFGEIGRSDVSHDGEDSFEALTSEGKSPCWVDLFGGSFMVFRGKEISEDFIFHERI